MAGMSKLYESPEVAHPTCTHPAVSSGAAARLAHTFLQFAGRSTVEALYNCTTTGSVTRVGRNQHQKALREVHPGQEYPRWQPYQCPLVLAPSADATLVLPRERRDTRGLGEVEQAQLASI
jgi:hypothetical protein